MIGAHYPVSPFEVVTRLEIFAFSLNAFMIINVILPTVLSLIGVRKSIVKASSLQFDLFLRHYLHLGIVDSS